MSLLSNRGRFSNDEKNNFLNEDNNISSQLSSLGKNPKKMFNIKKTPKVDNDIKSKLRIPENFYDNKFITKHQEYNEKIKKYNDTYFDEDNDNIRKNRYKRKLSPAAIVIMIVIELITLFAIIGIGTFIRVSNMTQKVTFDKSAVKNTNIDASTLEVMKGYKTIAIFGVDSRTGSVDKGNNSDVNIIANLNLETGDAQLVSVYRDLYFSVTDQNSYDKLNAAYRKGGPQAAVKAINKNLDLDINNFFSFNWKAVADGIELLGGVDLDITKSEYRYMNAFIHETCIATGIDSKNPAAHYISSTGYQHLDGVQAVAYGRLRLMDSDFQRVERQKKIIELCLQKAKKLDIPKLRLILEAVLPQIAYEFDMNEMLSILKIIKNINITASCGVPETNNIVTMEMGSSGDSVVPLSLEKAAIRLHEVLYNDYEYSPSIAVRRYSNRIIELKSKYAEENRIRASKKASEEEESKKKASINKKATRSTASKLKKKVASGSDIDDEDDINTDPNRDIDDDDVIPIMDDDIEYEEEPEEDNIDENDIDADNIDYIDIDNENDEDDDTNKESVDNVNKKSSIDNKDANVAVRSAPGETDNITSKNNDNKQNASITPLPLNEVPISDIPSGPSGSSSPNGTVVSGPPTGSIDNSTSNEGPRSVMPIVAPN